MATRALKLVWLLLCSGVLATTLWKFDGRPNSDIAEFLVLSMLALSFPSGLVFAAVAAGLYSVLWRAFGVTVRTSYVQLILEWTGFVALGYVQWFRVAPWLWKALQRKRGATISRQLGRG